MCNFSVVHGASVDIPESCLRDFQRKQFWKGYSPVITAMISSEVQVLIPAVAFCRARDTIFMFQHTIWEDGDLHEDLLQHMLLLQVGQACLHCQFDYSCCFFRISLSSKKRRQICWSSWLEFLSFRREINKTQLLLPNKKKRYIISYLCIYFSSLLIFISFNRVLLYGTSFFSTWMDQNLNLNC